MRHLGQSQDSDNTRIDVGIDLQDYYISVEWDIMQVPAVRNEKFYSCCEEPYPDIIFNITLRRKTLFYTVNLIIPCVGISFLSVLVFYLPSDSGEKVSKYTHFPVCCSETCFEVCQNAKNVTKYHFVIMLRKLLQFVP